MAQITNTEYRIFWGQPVVVTAQAQNYDNATFHRLRLIVTIDTSVFEFSSPVNSDALSVSFDISSAFQAVADKFKYESSVSTPYPALTATVVACSDYMINGQEYSGIDMSEATVIGPLYAGKLSDMERITGSVPERYSRKPTTPEIAFIGWTSLQPTAIGGSLTPTVPNVTAVNVSAGSAGGNNLYGIPAPRNGYELRFINSLGVHENIFVSGFPIISTQITTEYHTVSRQETLANFSRGVTVKSGDHEKWEMSAGPFDREWARWFVHEVLMARWMWIGIKNDNLIRYIPCHILPEETTQIVRSKDASLLEIPFTIELDIEGGPL